MPEIGNLGSVPRRELNIFYVLDTSGSMNGNAIDTLNRAMRDTIAVLKEQAHHNGDARLKISVLQFSTECAWMQQEGPVDAERFVWRNLEASGMTNMGRALRELDSKLSDDAFLQTLTGGLMPVIIFMTDGYPTDDYESALAEIIENKRFRKAVRIGFAIGGNPDVEMIARLAGSSNAVICSNDLRVFAQTLRFVSVTSSTIASRTRTTNKDLTGEEAVAQALMMAGISRADVAPDFFYKEQERPEDRRSDYFENEEYALEEEEDEFGDMEEDLPL